MALTTRTVSITVDRLQDLLDGYCGPNKTDDLHKLLEDPCKDGHMPIGWGGPVYCEVCAKFLYYEETATFTKEAVDRINSYPPSMYIQQIGRAKRTIAFSNPDRQNIDALRSRFGKSWINGVYGKFGPSPKLFSGKEWEVLGFDEAVPGGDYTAFAEQFKVPNTGPFAFLEDRQTALPKDWQTDALVRLIVDRTVPAMDVDVFMHGLWP